MIDYKPRTKTTRIILHDSHTGPEVTNVVEHLRVLGRQKGLLDIGYHVVIERGGSWFATRALDSIGSHLPGHNHDTFGICIAGNEESGITQAQEGSLAMILKMGRLQGLPLLGHYEIPRSGTRSSGCKCPCVDMNQLRYKLTGRETP